MRNPLPDSASRCKNRAAVSRFSHLRLATSAPKGVSDGSTFLRGISVEDDGTTIVVRPIGDIDLYTAPEVDSRLRGCSNGHKAIVVDVSQVEFIDSTGLTMLIQAHRRDPERFALRGTSPAVEHLLEISPPASSSPAWTASIQGTAERLRV